MTKGTLFVDSESDGLPSQRRSRSQVCIGHSPCQGRKWRRRELDPCVLKLAELFTWTRGDSLLIVKAMAFRSRRPPGPFGSDEFSLLGEPCLIYLYKYMAALGDLLEALLNAPLGYITSKMFILIKCLAYARAV